MAEENFPKVYNFALSPELADSILWWNLRSFKVEQPSFSVLFDHTLAVIWHVFNEDGAELYCLNKVDILWALRFLEAIDTTKISATDTVDINGLIAYFRKILIIRYSMEDENVVAENEKSMQDSIADNYQSSSALEEYLTADEISFDKRYATQIPGTSVQVKCTDDEILQRLKEWNPNIQTIEDVKALTNIIAAKNP